MFRSLSLRRRLTEMPVLSATDTALPDGDLFRAAAIIGIFAHAYHYVESSAYERIPDSILSPWAELSRRLQRPGAAPFVHRPQYLQLATDRSGRFRIRCGWRT